MFSNHGVYSILLPVPIGDQYDELASLGLGASHNLLFIPEIQSLLLNHINQSWRIIWLVSYNGGLHRQTLKFKV